MNGNKLYKRLVNREDLKDIPLLTVLKVAMAVLEEVNEIAEENVYEYVQ